MSKWKLQTREPDTCDPPGCSYIELWDVEVNPILRVLTVVAFNRVCPGHAATVSPDKMLWADGNWKPKKEYIEYQRKWFRRLNYLKWQVDNPDEKMPAQIANFSSDPVTTGSVIAPSQEEIDGMNQAYNWNKADNLRKNTAIRLITVEADIEEERDRVDWSFMGTGDSRVLSIDAKMLDAGQTNRVKAALDIQFGPTKVVIA